MLPIFRTYWSQITIMDRDGGYYGPPFKGFSGFTQGDPLYPTIFDVVVDTIICH